jgi:hypothetical protein
VYTVSVTDYDLGAGQVVQSAIKYVVDTSSPIPFGTQASAFISFDIIAGTSGSVATDVVGSEASEISYVSLFKRGGAYKFGIVYYDRANRSGFVNSSNQLELDIPWITEDLNNFDPSIYPSNTFIQGPASLGWEVKHRPPKWATHWQWVRTKEANYNRYVQWVCNHVVYVKTYLENLADEGDPDIPSIEVPFGDPDAVEVYISMRSISFYRDENSDSVISDFLPDPDDRIRLIATEVEGFFTSVFDIPIKAVRGEYLVIDLRDVGGFLPQIKDGYFLELYSPKAQLSERLYYEFSEEFEIGNPHTADRYHLGLTQDQDPANLIGTPALGTFQSGDTYYRGRKMPTRQYPGIAAPEEYPRNINQTVEFERFAESVFVSDFFVSNVFTEGRPNIENYDAREIRRNATVRFSNKTLVDTTIFAARNYEALNEKQLGSEYGAIRKLIAVAKAQQEGNVMLAIFELDTTAIYVEESILRDTFDTEIVAISEQVIGRNNKLRGGWGTLHPESVVLYDEQIYFFSVLGLKVVRYSKAGLHPISDYKQQSYFTNLCKEIQAQKEWVRVFGGFDPIYDEYVITLKRYDDVPPSEDTGEQDDIDDTPPAQGGSGGIIFYEPYSEPGSTWQTVVRDDGGSFIDDGVPTSTGPIKFTFCPDIFGPSPTVFTNGRALSASTMRVSGPSFVNNTSLEGGAYGGYGVCELAHNTAVAAWGPLFYGSCEEEDIDPPPPPDPIVPPEDPPSLPQTIAFHEPSNRWTTYYSFEPEYYAISGTDMVAFLEGRFWKMNVNPIHCNFMGVQYDAEVWFVCKKSPSDVKVFIDVSIEANMLWYPYEMATQEGQSTYLDPDDFEEREAVFYADILRDINTPNAVPPAVVTGDEMRSQTMLVKLKALNPEQSAILHFANIAYITSMGHFTT